MIAATCHCGAVRVEVPHPPATVTDCNCTLCRRYGVLWAYYNESDVHVSAQTGRDRRIHPRPERAALRPLQRVRVRDVLAKARCRADGNEMGVNARNFAPDELAAARVEQLDGLSF